MNRAGERRLPVVFVSLLSMLVSGTALGQLSFYDNWNPGAEWREADKGPGIAMEGTVNGYNFCEHYNEDPTTFKPYYQAPCDTDPFGDRAGLWRAVSHSTQPGPPNEVWAWHLVNVTPYYNYRLTFDCTGDEPESVFGNKWFAAFGYTKDLSATYAGYGGLLGGGLPNGFVGAEGVSARVSAGGYPRDDAWDSLSLDFDTGDGTTQIKLWGIVQNIDYTDTDIHLCMWIDCVRVSPLGPIVPTPTPPPTYAPSTNADGWEIYR